MELAHGRRSIRQNHLFRSLIDPLENDHDPQNPKALQSVQEGRHLCHQPQGNCAARNVVAVLGDPGVQP